MKIFISLWSAVIVAGLLLSGCGGNSQLVGQGNRPAWIDKGGKAFAGEEAKGLYGVGISQGINNESLARQASDGRARTELAKNLQVTIQAMLKDYQASTTAGDMKKSSEEQYVESTSKTIVDTTLSGVEIVDRWKAPDSDSYYSLAKLSADDLKKNLDSMKELDAAVRDYVKANAAKAFEDLDKNIDKQRGVSAPAVAPTTGQ